MAIRYVRSTSTGTGDGTSWANAYATINTAALASSAGDRIWVSHQHAESFAANANVTINAAAGTTAAPLEILCGNDSAEPPTAVSTGASCTSTGSGVINITGSFYCYGVLFSAGSGSNVINWTIGNSNGNEVQKYDNCTFKFGSTAQGGTLSLGSTSATASKRIIWENCTLHLQHSGQRLQVCGSDFEWRGGSAIAGATPTTNGLMTVGNNTAGRGGSAYIEGVDFSALSSSLPLFGGASNLGNGTFANVKLPSGWSTSTFSTAAFSGWGPRARLQNRDVQFRSEKAGSIAREATIVRTGGAHDGVSAYSWKMTAATEVGFAATRLVSDPIALINETTGVATTVKAHVVTDGVTLTDAEAWIEVRFLGVSGAAQSALISDAKTSVVATAANQTTSSATWTTTGLTSPVKQELGVTFTPLLAGVYAAYVVLAKPSTTMYACPLLDRS